MSQFLYLFENAILLGKITKLNILGRKHKDVFKKFQGSNITATLHITQSNRLTLQLLAFEVHSWKTNFFWQI